MHLNTRRLILVSLIWLLLTGKTVIRCSSGDDDFNVLPPDEDNRAPVASDAFYQISGAGPLTAFMRATDPDGDSLRYRVTSGPGLGSLRDIESGSGRFTYIPGGAGSDSFSFRANDGRRDSNVAVVSIRITSTGQAVPSEATAIVPPLSAIARDLADPDALWLQWSLPAGGFQRLGKRGEPLPLAPGVAKTSIPGWQPVWTAGVTPATRSITAASLPEGFALAQVDDAFAVRGRLLVTARRSDTQVWHSHDAGGSWQLLAGGLPGPARAARLMQDAVRPLQWQLVLDTGSGSQVLLSRDGGLSWRRLLTLPGPALQPMRCGTDMLCLIDQDGSHLWRLSLEP